MWLQDLEEILSRQGKKRDQDGQLGKDKSGEGAETGPLCAMTSQAGQRQGQGWIQQNSRFCGRGMVVYVSDQAMKSAKRRNLDEKYGFGGKKPRPQVGYCLVACEAVFWFVPISGTPDSSVAWQLRSTPRKRSKQNDKSSTHDMSASPWVRSLVVSAFSSPGKDFNVDLSLVPMAAHGREEAEARAARARAEEKARAKARAEVASRPSAQTVAVKTWRL